MSESINPRPPAHGPTGRVADSRDEAKAAFRAAWEAEGIVPMASDQSMRSVLLLNDDTTPMEFVVHVIERFFEADHESANQIMLAAQNEGSVECGVYPHEEAKAKALQVTDFARKHQHTLQCVIAQKS